MADGPNLSDERQVARGWPRLLFLALGTLAIIFVWRGIISSTFSFKEGRPLEASTTLAAAAWWFLGSIGIAHNGRRMRMLAYAAWAINLLLPFVALAARNWQLQAVSPWYQGGATYFYLPTVGALAALLWLVWSSPAKIATRNGG